MTTIKILPHAQLCPEGKTISAAPGTSVCEALLENGVAIEHACDMSCACTTCHVIVTQGDGNLSEAEDDELDRLDMAPGLTLHSRLGCQAIVKGDVSVEIPAWNRNYVSEGGGSMNLGDAIPPPR